MPDLYTSMTQLKQAMNGGTLPPMTPIPAKARAIIDPSFTIGLGALEEDPDKGLRCPVRGCGRYYRKLSHHISVKHKSIGGVAGVKKLLSIPATAPLVTSDIRERCSALMRSRMAAGYMPTPTLRNPAVRKRCLNAAKRASKTRRRTVGERNLANDCMAQLQGKLIDLHNELGRVPSITEGIAKYGDKFVIQVRRVFGTWNNLIKQAGLGNRNFKCVYTLDDVLVALEAWYEVHGDLPTPAQLNAGDRTPRTPAGETIRRAFKTDSHVEAMRQAAAILDIHGGRYGLPVKKESAA